MSAAMVRPSSPAPTRPSLGEVPAARFHLIRSASARSAPRDSWKPWNLKYSSRASFTANSQRMPPPLLVPPLLRGARGGGGASTSRSISVAVPGRPAPPCGDAEIAATGGGSGCGALHLTSALSSSGGSARQGSAHIGAASPSVAASPTVAFSPMVAASVLSSTFPGAASATGMPPATSAAEAIVARRSSQHPEDSSHRGASGHFSSAFRSYFLKGRSPS
mmetsp:Transcript_102497/g.289496  ORF Transcript_102497/g.289496 Transcript_102497/m.289496 type:complete len:220 (+) Transcript_102497:864-1523(+)